MALILKIKNNQQNAWIYDPFKFELCDTLTLLHIYKLLQANFPGKYHLSWDLQTETEILMVFDNKDEFLEWNLSCG